MRVAVVVALVSALGAASAARGQEVASGETACALPATTDSVSVLVYASVWTAGGARPLAADDAHALLAAIRRGFHLSSPLPLPAFDGAWPRSSLAISGALLVTLHGAHVDDVRLSASSGSPVLDAALLAAPVQAERLRVLPALHDERVQVVIAVTSFDATQPSERGVAAVEPIGRVEVPLWVTDRSAALAPWNEPVNAPRYAMPAGDGTGMPQAVHDTIVVQYVVDASGRVVLPTMLVESARYRETLDSVQRALPFLRYTPARVGGCAVAQLVRQPFAFVGSDTAEVDAAPPATIALQRRGDVLTALPAMLVGESRCPVVPESDTMRVRLTLIEKWGDTSGHVQRPVRLAGEPWRQREGAVVCPAALLPGERPPGVPPYTRAPGYQAPPHATRVVAEFLIDAKGRVDRTSIRIVRSNDPAVNYDVDLWLRDARFQPATIDGRPIPSYLRETVKQDVVQLTSVYY